MGQHRADRRRGGHDDSGATAVEYAIVASLIAVTITGAVTLLGQSVVALFASMPPGL